MLQRKQSIFLALAALLAFATWVLPITTYQRGEEVFILRTTGLFTGAGIEVPDVDMKVPFAILFTVLGAALAVWIFFYRDRPRQARFVRGTYLAILLVIALLFITDNSVQAYLEQGGTVKSSYGLSFVAPLVMLVLAFMAERAIKADEALVRSADRLR
jgi:uncharacterized membrane protein (UPF0182 family)